jgi:hypothetical protein
MMSKCNVGWVSRRRNPTYTVHHANQLRGVEMLGCASLTQPTHFQATLAGGLSLVGMKIVMRPYFLSITIMLAMTVPMPACADYPSQLSAPTQEEPMNSYDYLDQEIALTLRLADEKITEQDWVSANVLLKKGLATLGDSYLSADTIDETGMKLILADAAEENGDLQSAAKIRLKMLASRHAQLQGKIARRLGKP